MTESKRLSFLTFLDRGVARGGFETEDALAAVLPLMKQAIAAHSTGLVAPLEGIQAVTAEDERRLGFDPTKARPPTKNRSKVEALQLAISNAVDIVSHSRQTLDIHQSTLSISSLDLNSTGENITRPVFIEDYRSWEHAVGHHDELTDIYSLGMVLGSVICGLDFTNREDLELFTVHRTNLFSLNRRINPVVAAVIVEMTELDRRRRAPDLAQMILRLENYRDQPLARDFEKSEAFQNSNLAGRRRVIQAHLRDRLFEISRRNRLIYFKPALQTLNLTVASVPILMDYRNIKLEQLFVWHPALAAIVTEGGPLSLGKYLRFEDAEYIPGVLDKIISEARRDRAEYGFAQLRLVLCFLRWNNLKDSPNERIHSPLLLLPVELNKKKGVRDNYLLDPTTSEAEVNPALRHHLKELYNLELPEVVDLKQISLDQFYESLKASIGTSEPGVTLNKIDRPQIELIHEKARQRLDQHRRRIKLQAHKGRKREKPEYSYDREHFRPLGLQIFTEKVRPIPLPMRDAAGAPPRPRLPRIVDVEKSAEARNVLETDRKMFSLREGDNQNPYNWDFDLCSMTLGNFNYRKMTLVRDYANLIETDMESRAFDTVFSLTPKPPEEAAPPQLKLTEQNLVISCDATQASAISRARNGASYIIQGPPGTGKSQTITNLIADYVAQGKRVLFVCEKRAAIDVVFHRLRQQGLNELCCLIHDSQTDKKAFVLNLKQTYEKFLSQADFDLGVVKERATILRSLEQDLATLQDFSALMRKTHIHAGIPVRSLLHRLAELRRCAFELAPEIEELLPDYPLWLEYGELVERLESSLSDLGEERCFANHPLRWLGKSVLLADRPLEELSKRLDEAEDLLDGIENALGLSGLPAELWDSFEEIQVILEFSARAAPLVRSHVLGILTHGTEEHSFQETSQRLDGKDAALRRARDKAAGWINPLSPDDTENALAQANRCENSIFRFLQPAFWRLKKTLEARYDFRRHAVAPVWSKLLSELSDLHKAQKEWELAQGQAANEWNVADIDAFRARVVQLVNDPRTSHPSVAAFLKVLSKSSEAALLIQNLADIEKRFADLDATLRFTLAEHQKFDFSDLSSALSKLREQTGTLAELLPVLAELTGLPDGFTHALRHAPVALNEFEAAMGHKSMNRIFREERAVSRFDGRALARTMERLEKNYRTWLEMNARSILLAVRQKFLEHATMASQPISQLQPDQKSFKKSYSAGRRDLEHEFGKTMRYKSIRDLAAGDTGQVIQDLKPIWLMSPLSVSDTLPLDPELFDVVIFDEASQIPVEEAIPAIYRSHQTIVVGDEMQLPPTTFFASSRSHDEGVVGDEEDGERVEMDLDADSFLTQSALNLPSTLLAWHYRSRSESLISFSNAAFYSGKLHTVPDTQRTPGERTELIVSANDQGAENVDSVLARSISFHFMENGVYEDRRNPNEASYIAELVRGILKRETKLSIGVVAFSEAQQTEIETALGGLGAEDSEFAARLEMEAMREENDVFCGLFVKNLENVQGDERDIIIMSVCYGRDGNGRMLMNFGPINQRGGEKRLNVIFSRAKHHMAIVSSIRHDDITNDYNDGANSLKNFLKYAEAVSKGDEAQARRILETLNPFNHKTAAPAGEEDTVVKKLAAALQERGHSTDLNVGQSKFRCDLAIRNRSSDSYQLGILVDTDRHYASQNVLERYLMQPTILRAFGWNVLFVLTKDWYQDPDDVIRKIEKALKDQGGKNNTAKQQHELTEENAQSGGSHRLAPTQPRGETIAESNRGISIVRPRRFELMNGSSRKFWEITQSNHSVTVRFGRIGTIGQSQTKTCSTESEARTEIESLIAEKLKKGYSEIELA
jgi:predicted DNA-binding WGR domain protein